MATKDFKRKLSAILSADVAGYSRLMGEDEAATVSTIETYREVMSTLIKQHRGRVVDSPGDNALAEFGSVVDAVQCGMAVQNELQARNAELPENRRMKFRIGINLGDVIEEGDRIYGDGVNIAARLEALADPGGICVSKTAFDQIETKLPLGYEYLGDQTVKNIPKPVGAYRVLMEPRVTVVGEKEKALKAPFWRHKTVLAGGLAVLVAIIGVGVWNFYFRPLQIESASVERMAFPLPDKPSIAVLPFTNMSGDSEQEFLADGITENIITALSKTPNMFVIASNSVFTYKGAPVKVQKVSEELGVRYVLEGSVQRSGERLRISAQLIDAVEGYHLWAERYDRDLKDLFALQDEITLKILTALQVKLTRGEEARMHETTDNLEAWGFFVRGLSLFERFTKGDNAKARELFEQAVELDPGYAAAWSMLAWTHWIDASYGYSESPAESFSRAVELAQKAVVVDDTDPDVHALLGGIYLFKREYEQAIAEGEKAITLRPNDACNHALLAQTMIYAGRFEEAILLLNKAKRLNPIPPPWYFLFIGSAYGHARMYKESISAYKRTLHLDPDYLVAHIGLASVYSLAGREEEARSEAAEVLRIDPKFSLEGYTNALPFKNQADKELVIDSLRKAGLPDKPPLPLPDKPSIAVLPFTNISDDPKQEYFADGMTDDLITDLSKISDLLVIARNSAFTYKGKPVKIQQVAGDLGVRYVLEGSVRKAGNQVRINAQLIDATTGHHLWAERYDGVMDNIFDLQDKITQKIVSALALKLTAAEREHTASKETNNIEAYDAFLKGWEHYQRFTPEDFSTAISHFKRAIELDPDYGRAYAALALTYWMGTGQGEEWRTRAGIYLETHRLWARHYLQIAMKNPTSISHQVASLFALFRRQHEKAIVEAEKAIALEPNNHTGHLAMGRALIYAGRPQEATDFIKKAMLLDPHNIALPLYHLGTVHFCLGKLDEAASLNERALTHNPELMDPAIVLAAIYAHLGRDQEAQGMLKKLLKGEQFIPDLRTIMYMFPFKDLEVSDRFAGGLIKAGAGQFKEPLDYSKISKKNKLTGNEIRKLLFGRSIIVSALGYKWQISFTKDGKANYQASWGSASGTYWIEGDQLWIQWKYKFAGLKGDSDIYRNPSGTAESRNEYLRITDWAIFSFSVVDKTK